jgi:hypothetical protein
MKKDRTIKIEYVLKMSKNGINTFSKKDNSIRGCKTVTVSEIAVGDKIVIDNYFTLVIE